MADQYRIREEPIRIAPPVDIRVGPLGSDFGGAKSIATSYGGVSGRRTTKVHILYGMGSQYPSDVMEGLKSEELKAMNSPVADTSAIGAQPVAVWLFPPGNRAYYLPRAVVHVLIADIEVTALEEAIGWVDVPAEYATEDFVGTSRMIPADKPFFAYETYRAIIRQAKLSVLVVDRYARAASVLPLLTANPVREIRMLVDKDDLDLATRSAHFAKQYEVSVEVRRIKPYPIHDRFLVLDGRHVWHLGASLNTLNKSSLVRLLEASSSEEVRDMLETAWANATSVQPAT